MSNEIERRTFLSRMWKWGLGIIAGAAVWTSWDFLQPVAGQAGGPVTTIPPADVPSESVLEIPQMRGFLTQTDDAVVPLSWRCPHLGCKVPWCESSGQFECPCHGSVFNRVGEYRRGPSPRGMDRYEYEVVEGVIVADTSKVIQGAPAGTAETIDEPPRGPECIDASEE